MARHTQVSGSTMFLFLVHLQLTGPDIDLGAHSVIGRSLT